MARIHKTIEKKNLNDPDNHDDVGTHVEPDILECEVKWGVENISQNKASSGNAIPAELFRNLKDDAALNMSASLGNSSVATGLDKVSFHSSLRYTDDTTLMAESEEEPMSLL